MNFSLQPVHTIRTREESTNLLFEKHTRLDHLPTIPEFYSGLEIFITGGSGFMGKVLIEKLLRSCPDIRTIFVLLRSKKGKSIEQRLDDITSLPLFDPIRKFMPSVLHKLKVVSGDVTQLNLGLSCRDLQRLDNVSIIFHAAASVRFDDPLKEAILMNTRGTVEVLKIAENMKNIKVVLHVSTCYSNPKLYVVEEKLYPPAADWRKTIEICEKLDDDVLNLLTPLYTDNYPNTYTFAKNLAEHVVSDYSERVPCVIFRPSIVVSTMIEPFPGWVDNFNGPIGLLAGSAIGIVRTMHSNPDNLADFTPVDVSIKAMIIAAMKRALDPSETLPVYNCATSELAHPTMGQITEIGKSLTPQIPFEKMLWIPGGRITRCAPMNYVKTILFQLLPAMLIDLVLGLKMQKPFLSKIQRKIYEANCALKYFIMNDWVFKNDKFCSLSKTLRLEDEKDFEFLSFAERDLVTYLRYCVYGVKEFLLGDKLENLPRARNFYKKLKIVDTILRTIPKLFLFYFVFIKYDAIGWCREFFK